MQGRLCAVCARGSRTRVGVLWALYLVYPALPCLEQVRLEVAGVRPTVLQLCTVERAKLFITFFSPARSALVAPLHA